MKKNKIFELHIDSVIDIITNSSSELFVLKADTGEIIKELLSNVYPEYLTEYEEVRLLKDLSIDELDTYIGNIYDTYAPKEKCGIIEGFTFEEMYEPTRYKSTYGPQDYVLKDNFIEKNKEKILNTIDPFNKTWVLFSIDENPNWEYQEVLSNIATRYHLG